MSQANGAEAEKIDTNVERGKVMKNIKVKLGVAEVADRAKSASAQQISFDQLTEELNAHKSRLKPQIKAAQEEIHRLLDVIESGHEERTCEVEMVKDYSEGTVTYFYEGQQVEKHNMTTDDRQQTMDLPESAVGTQSQQEEIADIIDEETHRDTKTDLVV